MSSFLYTYFFRYYFCSYETFRCLLNQRFRQSSQQKVRRLSWGVVTMTTLPHSRQVNSRCTAIEDTFLECFQYNFSQCCEQNLVRQSLPSVTRTRLPHRRHVNSRITGAWREPSTRLSLIPWWLAYLLQVYPQYRWVTRVGVNSLPQTTHFIRILSCSCHSTAHVQSNTADDNRQ